MRFVTHIAVPVPLVVIAELMGLPVEDRVQLGHWSDRMMGGEGRSDPDDLAATDAGAAFGEYVAYLSELIEERRQALRRGRSVPAGTRSACWWGPTRAGSWCLATSCNTTS